MKIQGNKLAQTNRDNVKSIRRFPDKSGGADLGLLVFDPDSIGYHATAPPLLLDWLFADKRMHV